MRSRVSAMRTATPRLKRLLYALSIAVVFAFPIAYLQDHENISLLKRGDFPAFYAAAKIIAEGRGAELYDFKLQAEIENRYWPSLSGRFYAFAYPPYVAVLVSPLALLDAQTAKLVYTAIMLLALVATVFLSEQILPELRRHRFVTFIFFFGFGPLLNGMLASQNISLSMLLFAASLWNLSRGRRFRHDFLAGVLLGLWLFKPHYSLFALFFLALAGRIRVIFGAAIPALLYYFLGASVLGNQWPLIWKSSVYDFAIQDYLVNQQQMISIPGFLSTFVQTLWGNEIIPNQGLLIVSVLLSVVLVTLIGKQCSQIRRLRKADPEALAETDLFFLFAPAILLLSPHALFYEAGLCLLPLLRWECLRWEGLQPFSRVLAVALFLTMAFLLTLFKDLLPMQPLFFFVVWCFIEGYRKVSFSVSCRNAIAMVKNLEVENSWTADR